MQHARFRRWARFALREPLVHFLLLGAAIYAAAALARPAAEANRNDRITVTAGQIRWLGTSWQRKWNRPPTQEELSGLVEELVRETVLYREALAMGLDQDDTIIRRRLVQKLEFLSQDLVATVPPTEQELRAWFAERGERYRAPALTTFTHVFVDPDRRGERTLADAEAVAARLRTLGPPGENTASLGDPFLLQAYYPERSEREIAKLFGSEFAREVSRLEPGAWHGPLLSGYGPHLVWVEAHSPSEPAEFAAVRERVRRDWERERRRVFEEDFYARLRARYEIVIEEPGDPSYLARVAEAP